MATRFLTAKLAQQIDEELMGTVGAFSIDQLMELAGLACAQVLAKVYDKKSHPRALVCCGPGNQGGDGLVAARHLSMFGYQTTLFMPKPGSKDLYKRLLTQCTNNDIQSTSDLPGALAKADVILDAIFGFSFQGPIRSPFDTALPLLSQSKLPIVSVDIPSGWDVEKGNIDGVGLNPDVLLSLTLPKLGSKEFKGRHFLGGRFMSKQIIDQFNLDIPEYPGYEQIVELPKDYTSTETKL